jgi:hypothetical protein
MSEDARRSWGTPLDRIEKPLKIYVSGPYTAEDGHVVHDNVMRAVDVGLQLLQKGHFPYIPHLTHYVDQRARKKGICLQWNDYLEWDEAYIDVCDALLYLGGDSKGAKRELDYAEKIGKMIYLDIGNIPEISKEEGGSTRQDEIQVRRKGKIVRSTCSVH